MTMAGVIVCSDVQSRLSDGASLGTSVPPTFLPAFSRVNARFSPMPGSGQGQIESGLQSVGAQGAWKNMRTIVTRKTEAGSGLSFTTSTLRDFARDFMKQGTSEMNCQAEGQHCDLDLTKPQAASEVSRIAHPRLCRWLSGPLFFVLFLFAKPAMAAGPNCLVPGDYSTIQGAVNDANCTTISLLSATFTENVTISRAVTIVGAGNDPSGGKNASIVTAPATGGSVFTIQLPSSGNIIIVTIQNLQITGGHATYGGGINNVGATVLLNNLVITGNRADKDGGGIYNVGGGKLS